MIYVVATPPNKLDKKGRVSGWHPVPIDRSEKQRWRQYLSPLKGQGVQAIIASDLDADAANIAGDELRAPVHTNYVYRRFNFGKYHSRRLDVADDAVRKIEKKWQSTPDAPIQEGDSLTSFKKRFVVNVNKLLEGEKTVLFITDLKSIQVIRAEFDPHALITNGNAVPRGKIFKVAKNSNGKTPHTSQ